jgi:glycerol-3-phosphate dehydrogenase
MFEKRRGLMKVAIIGTTSWGTTLGLVLARKLGVAMPITERIYGVLFEGLGPAQAMAELIGGSKSPHS